MCTVSFISVNGKIFITSNRDEKLTRKKALRPYMYVHDSCKLIFPKDLEAGGTWITVKENGDAAVLLNGAFHAHIFDPPYRKSRGIIFLDLISTERPSSTFSKIDLANIQPFTIILLENNSLYELRWDGSERTCRQLPVNSPHIWSSATLYDEAAKKQRESWFEMFLNKTTTPTQQDIIQFHSTGGIGDSNTDMKMSRKNGYATVSITNILITESRTVMKYMDLLNDANTEISIALSSIEEVI